MSTDINVQRTFSGAPWEKKVGYCRAIRMGNTIAVTDTTSLNENGEIHAHGDAYAQAKRCLEIIESAIKPLGVDRRNIICTRMFVTDIKRWEEFGRAHGEFFENCPPATTMVEVKALIDSQMLIEIEADAVLL
jgi:enamine deaminase RidA (YjgF/YER057c/UK114 family)